MLGWPSSAFRAFQLPRRMSIVIVFAVVSTASARPSNTNIRPATAWAAAKSLTERAGLSEQVRKRRTEAAADAQVHRVADLERGGGRRARRVAARAGRPGDVRGAAVHREGERCGGVADERLERRTITACHGDLQRRRARATGRCDGALEDVQLTAEAGRDDAERPWLLLAADAGATLTEDAAAIMPSAAIELLRNVLPSVRAMVFVPPSCSRPAARCPAPPMQPTLGRGRDRSVERV